MTPSRVVKLILRREATYSSIWFLVSQIRKTIAYKKTPANCLSVNNLNLSVTTNLIIEDSKEKKVQFVQQHGDNTYKHSTYGLNYEIKVKRKDNYRSLSADLNFFLFDFFFFWDMVN